MLLDRSTFFVREKVAFVRLTDTYDILDPETQQVVGVARDEPSAGIKWLRLLVNKALLPTRVNVYEAEGHPPVISLTKPVSFLRSNITVQGPGGEPVGTLRSKLFSLGGGFYVNDTTGQPVAEVKGDWKGWNFRLLSSSGSEIGTVTKKWAGVGKELFTSADNYMIALNDGRSDARTRALLLAAALSIDIVFKERK